MNITKRSIRNAHTALFAPKGDRIYTWGDYLCGYALPSLERVFRVRGYIGSSCVSVRPSDAKLILAYADGVVEIRDGTTGKIDKALRLGTAIDKFALSACGRFAAVSKWKDSLTIFDLESAQALWSRAQAVRQLEWLSTDSALVVITEESKAETWSWPAEDQPRSTIQLSGQIYNLALSGTRLVTDSHPAISVKDLSDDAEVFRVPYQAISIPYWLHDGKLLVARKETCELYGSDGALLGTVVAPALTCYGHAFSPVRDDAVLCYSGSGIVLVEGFQSFMTTHTELPIPFIDRELRPEISEDVCQFPQASTEQRTVEVSTPEELMRELASFERAAWVPTLAEERSDAECSKFGGVPWLSANEPWPKCGQCDSYMNLFLQLNSADLPDQAREYFDGLLLQVFVCTYESTYDFCASYQAFSNAALVRVCRPVGPPAFGELPDVDLYDEQHIVGWTRKPDLPSDRELKTMGVTLADDHEFNFPIEGDKLLGWPAWQQNVERHECPVCHEGMRPIFQIDACRGVPAILGGGGRGWVVQCSKHRDTVAFHWTY
jgi:hypothetical protein